MALGLINQVLDEVEAEHEGKFDEETRWGRCGIPSSGSMTVRSDEQTIWRSEDVAVDGLVRAGVAVSRAGDVRLLGRSELPTAPDLPAACGHDARPAPRALRLIDDHPSSLEGVIETKVERAVPEWCALVEVAQTVLPTRR